MICGEGDVRVVTCGEGDVGVVTGSEDNDGVVPGSEGDVVVAGGDVGVICFRKIHFKMCENCHFWEKNLLMEEKYRLVFRGISPGDT